LIENHLREGEKPDCDELSGGNYGLEEEDAGSPKCTTLTYKGNV
jgi:hypothetical protein